MPKKLLDWGLLMIGALALIVFKVQSYLGGAYRCRAGYCKECDAKC